MYVYGFRDISTKCWTRYLLTISPDSMLTPTTPLRQYPTYRDTKEFICECGGMEAHEEWFVLDDANKICYKDTGLCFIIEKHGSAYKKTKNLQLVIDIIDVYDDY